MHQTVLTTKTGQCLRAVPVSVTRLAATACSLPLKAGSIWHLAVLHLDCLFLGANQRQVLTTVNAKGRCRRENSRNGLDGQVIWFV